jgi:tRNA A-37 threonylcarbamoyl transferase component Bud32
MFLTEANVLHYLVERQFGDPETAVTGEFAVRSLARRNRNFHVTWGIREYLVKQAKDWDSESRTSVEREAAVYRHQETSRSHLLPQCYSYDPLNSVLVIEFLSEHTELFRAPDRFAPELGRLCGETMGAFHREMQTGSMAAAFPGSSPWVLSLHEGGYLADPSAGQRELVRVVQRYPEFARSLGQLAAEWRDDSLTHGDWKLENCLISTDRNHLRMVDWELAGWGDAIWDVSSLLQSYWSFWMRWPSLFPIETIQPALRAFLSAYALSRGWDPGDFAARAIRFAGARMLQAAFDDLEKAEEVTGHAVRLMQGSLHVFTRPDWAAEQLLGASVRKMSAACTGS